MTRRRTSVSLQMMLALFLGKTVASRRILHRASTTSAFASFRPRVADFTRMMQANADDAAHRTMSSNSTHATATKDYADGNDEDRFVPPWSLPVLKAPSSKAYARFRQHVNPLSRRYQMQTDLPEDWPRCDFTDVGLPLYLDIGCGKGGFLLELVGRRNRSGSNPGDGIENGIRNDRYMNITKTLFRDSASDWLPAQMNYLGLEIRPGVSQYARARAEKRGLDGVLSFVGCNANVDLDRLLTLYRESSNKKGVAEGGGGSDSDENDNRLAFVSIQFPDPHFKKAHSKRRVVTPALVSTLAKHMGEGGAVFLQSDILDALESMRERFVEGDGTLYFEEWTDKESIKNDENAGREYGMENPLGIPTEREVSVVEKGLPVYRTLFKRNGVGF